MGSLYRGTCYPSSLLARREYCGESRESVNSSGSLVSHACAANTDFSSASFVVEVRTNGVFSSSYSSAWPPEFPCEYDGGVNLSLEYFGALLGFLVVVWLGRHLYRFFWPKNHEL